MHSTRPTGMRAFTVIWLGQVVSLLGTAMTQFALTLWAYELTQSATALALVALFSFAPGALLSPVIGALVDRWNRRLVMMLSDLGGGLATVAVFLLYTSGNLQVWHLYIAGALAGIFQAFQWPAYSAAISTMLPKEQYARANGMLGLAEAASGVLAPPLATALLVLIGLRGIFLIDIVSFIAAVSALLFVFIPQPPVTEAGREGRGSLVKESVFGFRYIFARPSLLGLQLVFTLTNLFATTSFALFAPMLLARTGSNEAVLATAQSAAALGGVAGGLLLSAWGGPKRRVYGVLVGMILTAAAQTASGMGQTVLVWAAASFVTGLVIPILNGSNQAIWQAKVAPDVQGRVFASRRLIAQVTIPFGAAIAGPLADNLFEPAMREGGALAGIFGGLVGTGPGAGIGLMFVLTGLAGIVVALLGFTVPAVRYAETRLPDHDTIPPVAEVAPAVI